MQAGSLVDITPLQRRLPRWTLGRRNAGHFFGIVVLALGSFILSAVVMDRTWDARAWVRHTRDVQLQIDRIVWDLLSIEHAMQAYKLSGDTEHASRFSQSRTDIRDDITRLAQLTDDNSHQQRLVVDFDEVFAPYLAKLEYMLALGAGRDVDRSRALAMSADATRLSNFIAQMREHEDGLLKERAARAETMLLALLPTLSFSAALIALLVVMTAQSINRIIGQREMALAEKADELAAKDMLMREVDHRARNSLGLVYNLMTFQQQRASNSDATREFLAEAANQVLVVARMHERLYKTGAADTLPVGDYLRDLCDDVAAYSLPVDSRSAIRVHAPDTMIPAEQAIWLGLIVVEFVTNALKYGAPSVHAPVLIDVTLEDAGLRITVSDRGRGLPHDFDPQASKGLGMQVVCLLIKQLRGTLGIDRDWSGARFVVTVPMISAAA